MDIIRRTALALSLLLAASGSASADGNFWLGMKAGTLGIGVEATWRPIDWLDLRLGGNRYDYDETGSQAGINYSGTLQLQTYYASANLRFPVSPFRITVGAYSNSNEILLASADSPIIEVGGITFTSTEVGSLASDTSWNSTSPYLGAGFDFELFGKVGLNFDFGVLLQGDPTVTLTADGTLAGDQLFMDALEAERSELEDDFDALKAYPVLSMGFNVNF